MVPIVPTLSSPVHRIFCALSQSLDRMKGGPWNRVYFRLAPGSKHNNMAAIMGQRVSSNWRFNQAYESPRGKAAGDLARIPFSFLGKDFRRQQRLRREQEQVVWKMRGFSQAAYCSHSWRTFGSDSSWKIRRRWTLWYQVSHFENILGNITIASISASGLYFETRIARCPFRSLIPTHGQSRIRDSGQCVVLNKRPRAHHETIISIAWDKCATEPRVSSVFQSRSSFLLYFHGRLCPSKRGPWGFEHNAAHLAHSQWIQAKKRKEEWKKKSRIELRQQLLCAPDIDFLPTAPRRWSKHPTRCACVNMDFRHQKFLPFKTRTNISIMCKSKESRGKLLKYSILF